MPAIAVHSVSKHYGALTALDNVHLSVAEGDFFALLGSNGAGKTTLISCLAGLIRSSHGTIEIMGHDVVSDYRAARRALGVVPQELVFDPFLTVRETLTFQSGYFGLVRNHAWIDEILFKLGLTDKAQANMRTLSGGMKRRVMVAQALVHRPPVIVLDEPTAGVDVELRQSLWAFMRELNQAGHTIVLTTHYLEEAEMLCNRIAMLKQGRVIAVDDTANLLAHSHLQVRLVLAEGAQLPVSVQPLLQAQEGTAVILKVVDVAALESVLTALRVAGVMVRELSTIETHLESVFVSMMNSNTERSRA